MSVIDKMPGDILSDLRDRGLSDAQLERLSADKLFSEYCEWHGLIGWGSDLIRALDILRSIKASAPHE